jgi:hypothetical protein
MTTFAASLDYDDLQIEYVDLVMVVMGLRRSTHCHVIDVNVKNDG